MNTHCTHLDRGSPIYSLGGSDYTYCWRCQDYIEEGKYEQKPSPVDVDHFDEFGHYRMQSFNKVPKRSPSRDDEEANLNDRE
jgi:hypothetical protein